MRDSDFRFSVSGGTKSCCIAFLVALPLLWCLPGAAQSSGRANPASTNRAAGDISNLATIRQAQHQAIEQARQMLGDTQNAQDRNNLQAAIREMERAQAALDEAEKLPEKLPTALAAEQNAYQALLKIIPPETRVRRSRNSQSGGGGGEQERQQLEQLDLSQEENRYETERQAATPRSQQQREQSELLEKLKALAQRQQDLNERLRELQTALQSAKDEAEKEELQRQLKRLRDEERQMLAEMDQMRQQANQSNAVDSETRQRMDRARSDMQRAAQEMENRSPSSALAAGSRAQQDIQNIREELRRQTSSQFTQQMREIRNQARELTKKQDEIARAMESLQNGPQSLDSSREGRDLASRLRSQQSALTNLLANMRAVTEQSENSEPVLSRQLYDTLRRADQSPTEQMLKTGAQLAERGFLQQAGEAQNIARTNLNSLRQDIERAAESVLGTETDALRFAQRELDDLTRQAELELSRATNSNSGASGVAASNGRTNQLAQARQASTELRNDSAQNDAQEGSKAQPGESGEQASGQGSAGNSSSQRAQSERGGDTQNPANTRADNPASGREGSSGRLGEIVQQLSRGGGRLGGEGTGPVTGADFVTWSDRLRDVELALDQPELRNQLEAVRERVATMRKEFRQQGRSPSENVLRNQVVAPLSEVRVWLQQELARQQNPNSLVPLDRDPVPDNYSELVRKYYERLGNAK